MNALWGFQLAAALPVDGTPLVSHALWEWGLFAAVVAILLIVDLRNHRDGKPISMVSALVWSVIWIAMAMVFMAGLFWQQNATVGMQFLAGYLVEKSLSVDNLFVFLVIFRFFKVSPASQHRVLFWGVLGAIVMRAALILFCVELVHYFSFMFFVFGGILLWSALKLARGEDHQADPGQSWVVRLARRLLPLDDQQTGDRFFIRRNGRLLATPLFLVLIVVEASDLLFAVDSIPAILAISQDFFIVLTSNIFAILGLRSLFFVLQGMMGKFRYLSVGLAVILAFIGLKLILMPKEGLVQLVTLKFGIEWTLSIIATVLAVSIAASYLIAEKPATGEKPVETDDPDPAAEKDFRSPVPELRKSPADGILAQNGTLPESQDDSTP